MMIMCHMIQKTITYSCHSYGSINIVNNGTNKYGNQQYDCHDCGAYRVSEPNGSSIHQEKEKALQAY
jgi:transposase-like protein